MKARLIFRVMCMLRGCRDSSFPNLYWYWISFVVIVLSAFFFYHYYSNHSYFYSVDSIKINADLFLIKVHCINSQTKSHSCKSKIHNYLSYGAQIINHQIVYIFLNLFEKLNFLCLFSISLILFFLAFTDINVCCYIICCLTLLINSCFLYRILKQYKNIT